jgi:serine/threonine protein kinase
MGRVYLGRSQAGRLVAVKTIRGEFVDDPDFRARFAHEVEAARRVSGAFTAPVVAADPDSSEPWLATSYVAAPSLERLVEECGPLPVATVRWLAAGCAEALDSIHEAGLIHRDLKPSNVLVSLDGPRVIDFGVSRAMARAALTTSRQPVGTPAYMAPEQARDTRQVTQASDVFSLGSTLLFAATGHPPYSGETVTDILIGLATSEPDLTGLPAELADLVTACMSRDPERRPTPAWLLEELGGSADQDFLGLAGDRNLLVAPGGRDLLGAPLTDDAVTLIQSFQPSPGYPAPPPEEAACQDQAEDEDPEDTLESEIPHYEEPARASPSALRRLLRLGGREPETRVEKADPEQHTNPSNNGPGRTSHVVALFALIVAAAALILAGTLIGRSLGGTQSRDQTPGQGRLPGPGAPPPPVSGAFAVPIGPPRIAVNQPFGDGDTEFVIHGTGWRPGALITVFVDGKSSPVAVTVDKAGTFNYVVDQGHVFFPGPLPPGIHRVRARGSGGGIARTRFRVTP